MIEETSLRKNNIIMFLFSISNIVDISNLDSFAR